MILNWMVAKSWLKKLIRQLVEVAEEDQEEEVLVAVAAAAVETVAAVAVATAAAVVAAAVATEPIEPTGSSQSRSPQ